MLRLELQQHAFRCNPRHVQQLLEAVVAAGNRCGLRVAHHCHDHRGLLPHREHVPDSHVGDRHLTEQTLSHEPLDCPVIVTAIHIHWHKIINVHFVTALAVLVVGEGHLSCWRAQTVPRLKILVCHHQFVTVLSDTCSMQARPAVSPLIRRCRKVALSHHQCSRPHLATLGLEARRAYRRHASAGERGFSS